MVKFPSIFINHGGGPLPLLGRQPELVQNMKDIVTNHLKPLKEEPKAIVMISAHWEESNPIKITASENPTMLYDYHGFPKETYEYQYPAPGSPTLAQTIQNLLGENGITSELDYDRGYDHGVFIPLMIMYPKANIPVVCVSLDGSLDAKRNMDIGKALSPLREDGVLILGSGYTFHNMNAFFNPTSKTYDASNKFNAWLKETILNDDDKSSDNDDTNKSKKKDHIEKMNEKFLQWDTLAPGARISHPREEHLLPLFMVAATASIDGDMPQLIYDTTVDAQTGKVSEHAITGYLFQ